MNSYYYCTLADVRAALKANVTDDDAILFGLIPVVSRRINTLLGIRFEPTHETRQVLVTSDRVSTYTNTFNVGKWMLSVSGVERVGVSQTTDLTSTAEGFPATIVPFQELYLSNRYDSWYRDCGSWGSNPSYVRVTGIFGFNTDYANAWRAEDAITNVGGITDSATSVTVADADGANADGITPRFSAGALIRIGDEYMRVLAVNTTTNILTVRRGENGTTAAAHLQGAAISVWQVAPDVRRATARQCGLLYARRGAYDVTTVNDAGGTTTYPQDLLKELIMTLQGYVYGDVFG